MASLVQSSLFGLKVAVGNDSFDGSPQPTPPHCELASSRRQTAGPGGGALRRERADWGGGGGTAPVPPVAPVQPAVPCHRDIMVTTCSRYGASSSWFTSLPTPRPFLTPRSPHLCGCRKLEQDSQQANGVRSMSEVCKAWRVPLGPTWGQLRQV